MDETIDNQQATLNAYVAGLIDGEGTFAITQYKQRNKRINTRICIGLSNTDREIIQTFLDFLKVNEINYYIFTNDRRKSGRKIQYQIEITSYKSKIKIIEILLPYLRKNRKYAEFFKEVCEYKLAKYEEWKRNGCNMKIKKGFIDEEKEQQFYEQYRALRESSETISRTPYKFR